MKDNKLYLIHIRECIERVEKYVGAGGKVEFILKRAISAMLQELG